MLRRPWCFLPLVLLVASLLPALPESTQTYLPLQQPGQASIIVDDTNRTLYIVDLGKSGDGDQVLVEDKPFLEWLGGRDFARLVVTCSHPHADHMGGIVTLLKNNAFFVREGKLRFESVTIIDNGMLNSLVPTLALTKGKLPIDLRAAFNPQHRSAIHANAFEGISKPGDSVFIENIPYGPAAAATPNGRPVVTRVVIDGKHINLDVDDAESPVIDKVVNTLLSRGDSRIDSFIVPHHGSSAHDVEPILKLKPKQAIVSVNPHNQYGHPDPDILIKLIDDLGPENVLFTGSDGPIRIGAAGIEQLKFTAADRDSYLLFVRPTLERAIVNKKLTPQKAEAFRKLHALMSEHPRADGAAIVIGKAPAGNLTDPAVGFWREQIENEGSLFSPEFIVGSIRAGGVPQSELLVASAGFQPPPGPVTVAVKAAAPASRSSQAAEALTLKGRPIADSDPVLLRPASKGGGPDLSSAAQPTTAARIRAGAPRARRRGGMVDLRGDRVVAAESTNVLYGGIVDTCALGLCVKAGDGTSYSLPFAASGLFWEVWDRVVNKNVDNFYLSINPTKEYLRNQGNFQIPNDRLHYGSLADSPAVPANRVVTAGGVENSQIGQILWEADVAFKSAALGFDVLRPGAAPATSGVGRSLLDQMPDSQGDSDVPQAGRWCRLYWSSGVQTLAVNETTHRIMLSGGAVIARAEGMQLADGELVEAPQAAWCEDMRQVAQTLESRGLSHQPGERVLNNLVQVAEMQNFARWAREHGIKAPALQAKLSPLRTVVAPVLVWTSGILSKSRTVLQTEATPGIGLLGEGRLLIHYSGSADEHDFKCLKGNMPSDDELIASGCSREKGGQWNHCDAVVRKWWTETPSKVQACTGAIAVGETDPTALRSAANRVMTSGSSEWGFDIHPTPVDVHGGVLLGAHRAFLESAWKTEGRLLAPNGRLIFQNADGDLHFWAFSDALGEHAVISGGEVKGAFAEDGQLRIVVSTTPGATIRQELRAAKSDELPTGLDFVEIRDASDGSTLLSKASWGCGEGCIGIADIVFDDLGDHLDPIEQDSPAIRLKPLNNNLWVVQIDLEEIRAQIRERADQTTDADSKMAAARLYAQWGFEDEALPLYDQVRKQIEGEAQDTTFARALGRNGVLGLFAVIVGADLEERQTTIASQVRGGHVSVSTALAQAKRFDQSIEQLPPEVAERLWENQAQILTEAIKISPPPMAESLRKTETKYKEQAILCGALAKEVPNPWTTDDK